MHCVGLRARVWCGLREREAPAGDNVFRRERRVDNVGRGDVGVQCVPVEERLERLAREKAMSAVLEIKRLLEVCGQRGVFCARGRVGREGDGFFYLDNVLWAAFDAPCVMPSEILAGCHRVEFCKV